MGSHENMNVPIWIFFGFQQRDRRDSQNLNSYSSFRLAVTSTQCNIGTERKTPLLADYQISTMTIRVRVLD